MKLLLDQNLSNRLLEGLAAHFPGSTHVRAVGLEQAVDDEVWNFATREGFAILTKDSDFLQRSLLFGAPAKVDWLGLGNCSTSRAADALLRAKETILELDADEERSFLMLG